MLGEDGRTQSDPAVFDIAITQSMHSSLHMFEVIFDVSICILKSKRSHYHLKIELSEFWPQNSKSPHDNLWCICYSPKVEHICALSAWIQNYNPLGAFLGMYVASIENYHKNPKKLDAWINSMKYLHHAKPPPSIVFSKPMLDIEKFMQVNVFFSPPQGMK